MMKLFQVCQKYMAIIGIRRLLPDEKFPFNRRNVGILFIFGQSFIAASAFLVFDAKTLKEYTECLYTWISVLGVLIGLALVIIRTEEIFQLIENMEKMVEQREFIDY